MEQDSQFRFSKSKHLPDLTVLQAAMDGFAYDRQGLILQLLNPKGVVATLPIATIQFPGAGIHGTGILVWSVVLAVLAIGAPGSYALVGHLLGRRIENPRFFRWFNRVMAALLFYVAASIGYEFVYLPLSG